MLFKKLRKEKIERWLKLSMVLFCYIVTILILFHSSVSCFFAKLGVSFAISLGITAVFIGVWWLAGGWQLGVWLDLNSAISFTSCDLELNCLVTL